MRIDERRERFNEAALQIPIVTANGGADSWKTSNMLGFANSARVIDGGLFLGGPNLDNFTGDVGGAVFLCMIKFPPEDEVLFAVYVRSGISDLEQRLALMSRLAEQGHEEYSTRNNNAKLFLAADGRMYLRNKGFWETLSLDEMGDEQPAVEVDRVAFAVHPPTVSARRSLLTSSFIGYLADMVGRDAISEIRPFAEDVGLSPQMQRHPEDVELAEIVRSIEEMGGYYTDDIVQRFHAALNHLRHKHFVILKGVSGSGKSQLVRFYAKAIHGIADDSQDDPFFFSCPVRPDWTDPTEVTGYYDVISDRYMVPPFLEAVLIATTHAETPVFVCLDEMNLAHVEYYLSEVLSSMETGVSLQIHSSRTPLDGSTGGDIPRRVPFPNNLYIIGTVNVDETTRRISDKVLDRAVVIDTSDVDIDGFMATLSKRNPSLSDTIEICEPVVSPVATVLGEYHQPFGYRVAEEFIRYVHFSVEKMERPPSITIDEQLCQKILTKIQGTEEHRGLLNGLQQVLADYPRSQALLDQLTQQLNDHGSFGAAH